MHFARRFHALLLAAACLATAGAAATGTLPALPQATAESAKSAVSAQAPPRVLVFTATAGFRHDAIPAALDTLRTVAADAGIAVEATEHAADFNDARLSRYRAVVFAHVTGEVLDASQQAAFERYVARGGGFMGMHAAADSGYTWPWYGDLVGAWFARHPEGLQSVRIRFAPGHGPPQARVWAVTDEIYDYRRNPRPRVDVVATVDPTSHPEGGMGEDHPISWCHRNAGGRAWYTGLGHNPALYADPVFRAHLGSGLRFVTGAAHDC